MPAAESTAFAAVGGRTAKTRKGKKILRKREPQVTEAAKTALILAGNKCSRDCQSLLKDLHCIRSPLATLFLRKHEEHPFEDVGRLETLCHKYDHSLFAFGSSSKKRPFRLILGRLFDGKLLDMQEFNVDQFKPMQSFGNHKQESLLGSKPLMLFQGAAFESNDELKRAKSLLMDFFKGESAEKVLLQGLEQVIVCSTFDVGAGGATAVGSSASAASAAAPIKSEAGRVAAAPPVLVRRFRIMMTKSGSRLPRIELSEMGPQFRLSLDRQKEPEKDRWRMAIKVPKAAKPKKEKSIQHDKTGNKRGQIHLGKQDFDKIHTVHHSKQKSKKLRADLAEQSSKSKGADDTIA